MAQILSPRSLTTEARVQYQSSPRRIRDGKTDIVTFSQNFFRTDTLSSSLSSPSSSSWYSTNHPGLFTLDGMHFTNNSVVKQRNFSVTFVLFICRLPFLNSFCLPLLCLLISLYVALFLRVCTSLSCVLSLCLFSSANRPLFVSALCPFHCVPCALTNLAPPRIFFLFIFSFIFLYCTLFLFFSVPLCL